MRIDKFSDLPEWDDDDFRDEEDEGEEWKPNPTRDACKALYEKWQEIMVMLGGVLEPDKEDEEEGDNIRLFDRERKQMLLGDAYEVGVKINSSEVGGMYVIRMENASIIRKNAQSIASAMLTLGYDNQVEEKYVELIREEINRFKGLFRAWVNTFEKDEFTDDWGLFI